jgi:hypothetical protein
MALIKKKDLRHNIFKFEPGKFYTSSIRHATRVRFLDMRQCFPGCAKFPPFKRNAYCLIKPHRVLQRAQKYMTEGGKFLPKKMSF